MVYEKKCSNCGKVLDFGGRENPNEKIENGIYFDDKLYCRECVNKLIEFGSGNIMKEIDDLKTKMQEVSEELGMNF